jgi:hypothetical protein
MEAFLLSIIRSGKKAKAILMKNLTTNKYRINIKHQKIMWIITLETLKNKSGDI